MREHGMTPPSDRGSVGSESAGDWAWQRALEQLGVTQDREGAAHARRN